MITVQLFESEILTTQKKVVFYGQEPPSGESTTTDCGFNYQLLAVIYEVAECGAPSCSWPQPATDNGVRDGRCNWLVAPPTLHRAVLPELHVLHRSMRAANHKTYCTDWDANMRPSERQANALPVWLLRVTNLIICMTQWKIYHMCRCVTISDKHRDTTS